MLKVGLTGGIASGKSFVAEALAGYGCFVIQADEIGHQVLAPGGEAYAEAVREFGAEILMADGAADSKNIDRRRLASLVFADAGKLARLNAIVHPAVIRREEELAAEFFAREPHGIAVVEAAILIETGSYHRFDKLILVFCAQEQQIERAMRRETSRETTGRDACRTSNEEQRCEATGRDACRTGNEEQRRETTGRDACRATVAEADIRARIGRQMPLEEKRKYADFVVDTSGTKEDTLRQTRTIYEELRRIES